MREPAPEPVWAVHAPTLERLLQVLEDSGRGADSLVGSDVSLGGWRGHQVATELSAQLGIAAHPAPPGSGELQRGMPSYADLIGRGIDAEARGEQSVLTALEAAERIGVALDDCSSPTVVIMAPRHGLPWEADDLLAVRLLAPRLGPSARLVIAYGDAQGLPDELSIEPTVEWLNAPPPCPPPRSTVSDLAALVPGIIDPQVARALDAQQDPRASEAPGLALRRGHFLVAPERRRRFADVSRFEYDRLAAATAGVGWLHAHAQYLGNNAFVDAAFLVREAWQRFTEGAGDLALRLLERAATCATPEERAIAQCQAQGIRIALGRFEDAAGVADPSPALAPELRRFLLLAKGYALVMIDDVECAQPSLNEGRLLLEVLDDDREHLYLLNSAALGQLKRGDPEAALVTEREMAARLKRLARPDWRLGYVNAVNIARLSRRLGDFDGAERSYADAFDITLGGRSESEAVYTNVCLAKLNAARGDRPEEAFACWLRAAVHWVAARAPEALGARVVKALTGHVVASPGRLVEEVSAALARSLAAAARAWGRPELGECAAAELDETRAPAFVHADALYSMEAPGRVVAVGASGWGVLSGPSEAVSARGRPATRRLRAVVVRAMALLSETGDLLDAGVVYVDDRLGQEIPREPRELVESALRLGASGVWFQGRAPVALDALERARLERCLRVQPGPGVDSIEVAGDAVVVRFKRSEDALTLAAELSQILTAVESRPLVRELAALVKPHPASADLMAQLRMLEAARVVYLSGSGELCTTAGIS
jgi:tetratricopeptide (TPR) repeat protein